MTLDGGNQVLSDGDGSPDPSGGFGAVVSGDPSWTDVSVRQRIQSQAAGNNFSDAHLVARYVDSDNMIVGGITSKNSLEIWERVGGTWNLLGSGNPAAFGLSLGDGNWHTQELQVIGNTATLIIDDVVIGSSTLSVGAPANGQTGFWAQSGGREAWRDDHQVRVLNGVALTTTVGVESDQSAFSIDENSINGTGVGFVLATDEDASDILSFTVTGGTGMGVFDVNLTSGEITVIDSSALDAETTPSFTLVVQAEDDGASPLSDTITITIDLSDVNEFTVGTIIDSDGTVDSVAENSAIGMTVGFTAFANDPDVTDNVSYSLDDDAGGRFAVNATTGVVTVNGSLDAETSTSHNITVRATSDDASFDTRVFTISVTDISEFDISSISDSDSAAETVAENVAVGTVVGVTGFADDADVGDTASYSLDNDAGGLFIIDSLTGVVTVNATLDAETSTSHNITVRATSTDTSFSTRDFRIAVTDVDESDTGLITDTDATADSVAENSGIGATVGITALAVDADVDDNISYSLDADAGGRFIINSLTGVVTVNAALDAETATSHNITVRATSDDTSFDTRVFTITVTDVDEFILTPIVDTDVATETVAENAAIGATVGVTALASDADVGDNVTYSLDVDVGGLFTINSLTGVVTVNSALDAETATSHLITVRATSDDASVSTLDFTITVTDIDEAAVGSIIDNDAAIDEVSEDAANGTVVGITAFADDADVSDNVTYILDDNAGGRFAIDATSGVISVADTSLIDFETLTSHNVTVRATSDGTTFSTAIFTIGVQDAPDNGAGPISDTDALPDSVAENATIGAAVGITAFSNDIDPADNISYSLDDDAGGRFIIEATTGVVTVNAALDAEVATSHNIIIRATSDDTSFTTRAFSIAVTDANESGIGPISDSNASAETVAEDATVGTTVGITALASDLDVDDDITYSLDADAGGLFTIDATTGVVTVNAALDAETSTSHNITVRATSDDTTFSTAVFAISVTDVDEFDAGPISDTDPAAESVAENAAIGAAVGITAFAADADVDDNIAYSLDVDAGGRFTIDATTGVVTVNATLDAEFATSHNITVRATSDDTSFSTQGFTISVADVNESAIGGINDTDVAIDSVAENASIGTAVGITAVANDPDVDDDVSYSLDDNAGGRCRPGGQRPVPENRCRPSKRSRARAPDRGLPTAGHQDQEPQGVCLHGDRGAHENANRECRWLAAGSRCLSRSAASSRWKNLARPDAISGL